MTKAEVYDSVKTMCPYSASKFILGVLENTLHIPSDAHKALDHRAYIIGQKLKVSLHHIPRLEQQLDYLLDKAFPSEPTLHELSGLVNKYHIIPGHTLRWAIRGLSQRFKVTFDDSLSDDMKVKLLKAMSTVYESEE